MGSLGPQYENAKNVARANARDTFFATVAYFKGLQLVPPPGDFSNILEKFDFSRIGQIRLLD